MVVRFVVVALLLSPYLPNVFPLLALLGFASITVLMVGFLLYTQYASGKPPPASRARFRSPVLQLMASKRVSGNGAYLAALPVGPAPTATASSVAATTAAAAAAAGSLAQPNAPTGLTSTTLNDPAMDAASGGGGAAGSSVPQPQQQRQPAVSPADTMLRRSISGFMHEIFRSEVLAPIRSRFPWLFGLRPNVPLPTPSSARSATTNAAPLSASPSRPGRPPAIVRQSQSPGIPFSIGAMIAGQRADPSAATTAPPLPASFEDTPAGSVFPPQTWQGQVFGAFLQGDPQVDKAIAQDPLTLLLVEQLEAASVALADWIRQQRTQHLHDRIWVQTLTIVRAHVKQYRNVRSDVVREANAARNRLSTSTALGALGGSVGSGLSSPSGSAPGLSVLSASMSLSTGILSGSGAGLSGNRTDTSASAASALDSATESDGHAGSDSGLPPAPPPRHLDDFNDFSVDPGDDAAAWSASVDDINEKVVVRMAGLGLLHQAIGKGSAHEQTYLRNAFDKLIATLKTRPPAPSTSSTTAGPATARADPRQPLSTLQVQAGPETSSPWTPTSSNLLRILMREYSVCQLIWPFVERYATPHVLNQTIIDRSQHRIGTLKAAKALRSHLDASFVQYPPVFLMPSRSSSFNPASMSISERHRFFERLSKYSRKARSVIDVEAVRHEITRELKKRIEELRDESGEARSPDQTDDLRRYIRSLEVLKLKFDKRLTFLNLSFAEGGQQQRISKRISIPIMATFAKNDRLEQSEARLELSLVGILNEYANSTEQGRAANASSLHYFLDFLEQHEGGSGVACLRLWLAAEKYRRLLWRIQPDITLRERTIGAGDMDWPESGEQLSPSVHDRLRKEAQKIYRAFLSPTSPTSVPVILPKHIVESFSRYIAPQLQTEIQPSSNSSTVPLSAAHASPQATPQPQHADPSEKDYRCVFQAQQVMQAELEDDFKEFLHSEPYFRWSSEQERAKLARRDHETIPGAGVSGAAAGPGNRGLGTSSITGNTTGVGPSASGPTTSSSIYGGIDGPVLGIGSAAGSSSLTNSSVSGGSVASGPAYPSGKGGLNAYMNAAVSGGLGTQIGNVGGFDGAMGSLLMPLTEGTPVTVNRNNSISSSNRAALAEITEDATGQRFNQSALLVSLSRELDTAVSKMIAQRRPLSTAVTVPSSGGTASNAPAGRFDRSVGRNASVMLQQSIFDFGNADMDIITLDETNAADQLDQAGGGDTSLAELGRAATFKELDDDADLRPPGELLTSVTKLQQVVDDINKVKLQLECLTLLESRLLGQAQSQRHASQQQQAPHAIDQHKVAALGVLAQTKSLLDVEIGELSWQKAKYESQEQREAIMPGQCTIKIQATEDIPISARDDIAGLGGRVTFYIIQIERIDRRTGWTVRRRYNDFNALYNKLRREFPNANLAEFPGKGMGLFSRLKNDDLKQARMAALQEFMQSVVMSRELCKSGIVRDFLSSTFQSAQRRGGGFLRQPFDPSKGVNQELISPAESAFKRKSRGFAQTITQLAAKPLRSRASGSKLGSAGGSSTNSRSSSMSTANPGAATSSANADGQQPRKNRFSSLLDGTGRPWRKSDASATQGSVVAAGPLDPAGIVSASAMIMSPVIGKHQQSGGQSSAASAIQGSASLQTSSAQSTPPTSTGRQKRFFRKKSERRGSIGQVLFGTRDAAAVLASASATPSPAGGAGPLLATGGEATAIPTAIESTDDDDDIEYTDDEDAGDGGPDDAPSRKQTLSLTSAMEKARAQAVSLAASAAHGMTQPATDATTTAAAALPANHGVPLTRSVEDFREVKSASDISDYSEEYVEEDWGETGSEDEKTTAADADADPSELEQMGPILYRLEDQVLTDPLCSLLMEVFEFREQSQMLRRSAAEMLLKNVFGVSSKIEERLSQWLRSMVQDENLAQLMQMLLQPTDSSRGRSLYRHMLDLHMVLAPPAAARQSAIRIEAKNKLLAACPEAFYRTLGAEAATQGVVRLFEVFQSTPLNKHLLYTLLDALVVIVVNEL
ncbi:hypothetical protein BC831DRAFT_443726 [Entophlyctis helioformis]|nr:hypothetical protein BC831DRAFT_443726 [Entophlyctis helioformis]